MKALSRNTLLLLLSSTGFCIASGARIRAGSGVEDETPQELLNHDVAEADEHPTASADITDDHSFVLKLIAERFNVSIEEAKEVRGVQHDFDVLVDDLFEDVNFLQAEVPTELNGPFVLMFKNGKVPEKGQDGIKKFREKNKNTKLEIVHSRLSLEEAEDRGERILAKLESKGHSHAGFAIDGDDLEVWVKQPRRERDLGEVEGEDNGKVSFSRTAEILDLDYDDRDLEGLEMHLFEHDDEDPVIHHDEDLAFHQGKDGADSTQERPGARNLEAQQRIRPVIGGSELWKYGFASCTTAFVVQNTKSKKCGVLSAGHCNNYQFMRSSLHKKSPLINLDQPKDNLSITKKGEYVWYSFDTSQNPATSQMYVKHVDNHSKSEHVTKTANNIKKGQTICFFSRVQGKRSCATVRYQSSTVRDVTNHKFEKVAVMQHENAIAEGADSGGPWFWYDENDLDIVAHGVHGGKFPCHPDEGVHCYFFSKIKFIKSKLGVKVVTASRPDCNP